MPPSSATPEHPPSWGICGDPAIGFDLATWQGTDIAWAASIALGVKWSIFKSWHGTSPVATAAPQIDGARAAGVAVLGRYAWLLPDVSIDAQVKAWCAIPRSPRDLPLTIDWEHPDTTLRGRALVAKLERAVSMVADATGELPIVYTGEWYWSGYCQNIDSEIVAACPLHLAAYPRKASTGLRYREAVAEVCGGAMPAVPLPWRSRNIEPVSWQFDGDHGLYLPSLSTAEGGDVDVNVAAWARLLELTRPSPARPTREPGLQLGNDGAPNDPYVVDRKEAADDDVPPTKPEAK